MKGYSRYVKWMVALVLTLVPVLVFGTPTDMAGSSPLWDMFQKLSFTPPVSDMSVTFLVKMFGNVPGVPQFAAGGSTIVGLVFGMFNAGILALSGVFLSYTVTKILTETTMDGAAMGKGTTIWTAVRCALSTSLLVPQPGGYSMVNSIIMWVVVQSVGLADVTWSTAMDYLKGGGAVYASPTSIVDYSLINYDVLADNALIDVTNKPKTANVGSADVLRSLTCSYVVLAALRNRQDLNRLELAQDRDANAGQFSTPEKETEYNKASSPLPEKSESGFSIYRHVDYTCPDSGAQCEGGTVQFPYIKGESTNTYDKDYGLLNPIGEKGLPRDLTGKCGTIGYVLTKGSQDSTVYSERAKRYTAAKRDGLLSMIQYLEPTARKIVNEIKLSEGKRQRDPDTYVVYSDSAKSPSDQLFLKDKNANVKFGTSNQLVTDLLARDLGSMPAISNWPLGADEMLSAAATYQAALSGAQTSLKTALTDLELQRFEKTKAQGWITAGNYYRLLSAMNRDVEIEYNSYRLTGYETPDLRFADEDSAGNRDTNAGYNTLFKQAMGIVGVAAYNPTTSIAKAWTSDGDRELLGKTLNWIYLTYPYAKLHGKILTPSLSETATGTAEQELNKQAFRSAISWVTTSETALWFQVAGGVILLVTLPPLAIPVLINVPMDFLYIDVNKIFAEWNTNMGPDSTTKDPIIKLQNVGNSMIKNALAYAKQIQIYFGVIAAAVTAAQIIMTVVSWAVSWGSFWGTLTGVQDASNTMVSVYSSLFSMTQTIIFMYLPVAMAVIGPIFVSGIVFSIYVPLIPYLLFLFGVISWFISVLVLMAAAPIICFLMLWGNSSQENPLLSREAEQFVMQIIGVFFRPVLMIIGLVTGMVLSYIGVDLLNLGFANILEIVVTETENQGLKLVQQIGIIVVYTFTMVSIVNMCFSTIHLLYSEAMRVAGITAPAVGMEEKHMEGVKGGVTQFAEAGASGMKEGAGSLKGAAGKPESSFKDSRTLDQKKEDNDAREKKKAAKKGGATSGK